MRRRASQGIHSHRCRVVPDFLVRGGGTVALGVLSSPTLQRLLGFTGRPVAMTSANLSGRADGVLVDLELMSEQIGDEVDLILGAGIRAPRRRRRSSRFRMVGC
ncbi:Sua5/YciO/YrdC/YwlC family protein [Actinomyces ruminicola]|uniref:L-threonylcarbamoyladenylate synthase n=1 Tax=Actinomyces ruminicola TaxID=332524 RepID=UPI000B852171